MRKALYTVFLNLRVSLVVESLLLLDIAFVNLPTFLFAATLHSPLNCFFNLWSISIWCLLYLTVSQCFHYLKDPTLCWDFFLLTLHSVVVWTSSSLYTVPQHDNIWSSPVSIFCSCTRPCRHYRLQKSTLRNQLNVKRYFAKQNG